MLQNLLTVRKIKFKRSDFLDITPNNDRTITINCEDFRDILAMKIKELAAKRLQTMLEKWAKEEDDVQDQNYTVS